MAIPIVKSMGLNVITNGSAQNQERVMRLGADRFIDYKSKDYSKALYDVDYVLDTLGVREPEKRIQHLKIRRKPRFSAWVAKRRICRPYGYANHEAILIRPCGKQV